MAITSSGANTKAIERLMPGDRSVNRAYNCQKAPRNVKEYEGIQSRVNECDSTERKLSRVGKTSAIYTQQRAFESRPKESYQSEYGPEYAENRNLNSFKQVPCTASPSGR